MARGPLPGDGIGRGNGAGSARTQFSSGMPSANPAGRPRKAKVPPNASLKEAALKALAASIYRDLPKDAVANLVAMLAKEGIVDLD